jgi:hypothetical protein
LLLLPFGLSAIGCAIGMWYLYRRNFKPSIILGITLTICLLVVQTLFIYVAFRGVE